MRLINRFRKMFDLPVPLTEDDKHWFKTVGEVVETIAPGEVYRLETHKDYHDNQHFSIDSESPLALKAFSIVAQVLNEIADAQVNGTIDEYTSMSVEDAKLVIERLSP